MDKMIPSYVTSEIRQLKVTNNDQYNDKNRSWLNERQ